MIIFVFDRIENIVGKGENAGYQHFLLFLHCFQKASFSRSLKVGIVWYRVMPPFPERGSLCKFLSFQQTCIYNGAEYQVGESVTGDPCDKCTCTQYGLMCELIHCPTTHCVDSYIPDGECCRVCPTGECLFELYMLFCVLLPYNPNLIMRKRPFENIIGEVNDKCTCTQYGLMCELIHCPTIHCLDSCIADVECCLVCPTRK